jgi:hypothetical protein
MEFHVWSQHLWHSASHAFVTFNSHNWLLCNVILDHKKWFGNFLLFAILYPYVCRKELIFDFN